MIAWFDPTAPDCPDAAARYSNECAQALDEMDRHFRERAYSILENVDLGVCEFDAEVLTVTNAHREAIMTAVFYKLVDIFENHPKRHELLDGITWAMDYMAPTKDYYARVLKDALDKILGAR